MRSSLLIMLPLGIMMMKPVPPANAATADNPLATRVQEDDELFGRDLLQSAIVQAEERLIGQSWHAAVTPLSSETLASFPDALKEFTFAASLSVLDADAARPDILRTEVRMHTLDGVPIPGSFIAINNPDTIYRQAPLDGASAYVLTGRRSPIPAINNNFSIISPTMVTLANLAGEDLVVAQDGTFTITIDDTPANGRANHLQIPAGATTLYMRDTMNDWFDQRPNTLSIRRVSGPAASAPLGFETLKARVVTTMPTYLNAVLAVNGIIQAAGVNSLPQPVIRQTGMFLATQAASLGHFLLTDDEAYVLTLKLGGAAYMTFPVNNLWQVQPDYIHHTSSLNNAQAIANPDGTYTFVLSVKDPGVYNWVDPVGQHEVITQLRWQGIPSTLPASGGPAIVSQSLVKLSELRAALPTTMVYVTKAQRLLQQQERARSIAWRQPTG